MTWFDDSRTDTGTDTSSDSGNDAGARDVDALLRRLDGLESRSLAHQAELLDGVRRGLDDALARPGAG